MRAGYATWGTVSWLLQFSGPHLSFEGEAQDPVFMFTSTGFYRGTLDMLPDSTQEDLDLDREPIFAVIASITLWCIWKARCSHVLSNEPSTTQETLGIIWTELIHTLRSQYDSSTGSSRAAEERRFSFIRTWGRSSLFFEFSGGSIHWHYPPPHWFLLYGSYRPP